MVKMMTMETVTGWPADDCTRTTSTEARSDTDADTVYILLPGSVDCSTIPQHRRPLSPQSLNTAGHWVRTQDSLVKPSSRSTTWYKNGTKRFHVSSDYYTSAVVHKVFDCISVITFGNFYTAATGNGCENHTFAYYLFIIYLLLSSKRHHLLMTLSVCFSILPDNECRHSGWCRQFYCGRMQHFLMIKTQQKS